MASRFSFLIRFILATILAGPASIENEMYSLDRFNNPFLHFVCTFWTKTRHISCIIYYLLAIIVLCNRLLGLAHYCIDMLPSLLNLTDTVFIFIIHCIFSAHNAIKGKHLQNNIIGILSYQNLLLYKKYNRLLCNF